MLEWLANNYKKFGCALEFVTDRSEEGNQFCKGFGGIGGVLRYSVRCRRARRAVGRARACWAPSSQSAQVQALGAPFQCPLAPPSHTCTSSSSNAPQVDLTEFEEPDEDGGSDDALWSEEEDFF
jgi:hypothetical protein